MYCLYFICALKYYVITHVKITRHWKSTLTKQICASTYLDWVVKYQVSFFHSSSQCEQVYSDRS